MDAMTKAMLREAGFKNGSVGELLGLDNAQSAIVESKVRLTALLREERKAHGWSQKKLADALGTKQQVVARAEMGHRSVTLDFLFRALLALGVTLGQIARELESGENFLDTQRNVGAVELVEIAPIRGLVRPERVAVNSNISNVRPLLEMVQSGMMRETTKEARADKTKISGKASSNKDLLAA